MISAPAGFGKTTLAVGTVLDGLNTIVVGWVPASLFWVGLIANAAVGFLLPIINGSYGVTLQSVIVPEMQDRVFAFIMSAAMLISPLALMMAGPIADAFGIQTWFLIAGLACTLLGLPGFFSRDAMGMENRSMETHPFRPSHTNLERSKAS